MLLSRIAHSLAPLLAVGMLIAGSYTSAVAHAVYASSASMPSAALPTVYFLAAPNANTEELQLYVGEIGKDPIQLTDLAGGIVQDSIKVSPTGRMLAFLQAVSENSSQVKLLRVSDNQVSDASFPSGLQVRGRPAWNATGTLLAVVGETAVAVDTVRKIYVLDVNAGTVSVLDVSGEGYSTDGLNQLAWSPVSAQLAFRAGDSVLVHDFTTGKTRVLLKGTEKWGYYRPIWSPDGSRLMVLRDNLDSPNLDIIVVNSDGSGQKQLTDMAGDEDFPAWSPSGGQIVFSEILPAACTDTCKANIYVVDANGANVKQLTNTEGQEYSSAWSPDGSTIAFISMRDGVEQVYAMDANGLNQHPLFPSGVHQESPNWAVVLKQAFLPVIAKPGSGSH